MKGVANGANLRVLIVDPNSKAAELVKANSLTSEFTRDIETTLEYLRLIVQKGSKAGGGKVEVRFMDWVPSCALTIIDANKPKGYLKVTIYPPYYEASVNTRAHFTLTSLADEYWYCTFVEQYELLWAHAKHIDMA